MTEVHVVTKTDAESKKMCVYDGWFNIISEIFKWIYGLRSDSEQRTCPRLNSIRLIIDNLLTRG